jgi:MoaA/NifB/PqqE/SkfB family radical SAM enzyme
MAASGGKSSGGQAPDENWKGRFCHVPFEHFEPIDNGEVFICCPTHVPYSIGNIYKQSADEIWNSSEVQEIRASILDGSFRYCSKMHCDRLLGGTLPRREAVKALPQSTHVANLPKEVVLNHDRSCNLSCPSCRTEVIASGSKDREILDRVKPDIVRLANAAEHLVITNAGDPFASKHYRSVLQDIRPASSQWLKLYTNAQLFTQQEWDKLQHLHETNIFVDISIDASTAETYQVLRRGGSFERLVKNLELVSSLRRENKIKRFTINMTVQRRNLLEMADFAKWGIAMGCDLVYFLRIRNWGTFKPEEFLDLDVCAPSHPLFDAYCETVGDEVFKDPRVSLATLPRPVPGARKTVAA